MQAESANFGFLKAHGDQLFSLAALAERYFRTDPNTCLFKLRQFAELLAREVAARAGQLERDDEAFSEVLGDIKRSGHAPPKVLDLFHYLRRFGNEAAHQGRDDFATALTALKVAQQLGLWYARSYGKQPGLTLGPFVPPAAPQDPTAELRAELERLRGEADASRTAAEAAEARAAALREEHLSAQARAAQEAQEREVWQKLAEDAEAGTARVREELHALQAAAAQAPPAAISMLSFAAAEAADKVTLDEAATREIIDEQLRNAGWEADTVNLRHAKGARPVKGRDRAIAEWPTASGPADYALFSGLTLVGVVEAKRRNRNVMEVLPQAERYSKGIDIGAESIGLGGPWGEHRAPFIFSTNGRPYLKQLEAFSGIWRRDVRRPTNPAGALSAWPSPAGLLDKLEVDRDAAEKALASTGFEFGFPLRTYQREAIEAVEKALAAEQTRLLVAMATGTGKTKLAIAMLYRLISTKRFRHVCFVVDRSALGEQTEDQFTTTKVVSGKSFAEIFGLKGLEDVTPDPETRVHICTIQGLVKRVIYTDEPADVPPVDQYDLIVIDECHRGYLLDREMSEGELTFRDQNDYVSKYRRVLDHFDAVKIGLTATPALHTVEIFGKPVFTYSYREAVIDGHLIDHEPPVRITTALAEGGIHFAAAEEVPFVDTRSGKLDLFNLPDALDFEVEAFNKTVITENFNRAVAAELTSYIDLDDPDKTLVFAASDAHADIVVKALREAFRDAYGEVEDADIRKVTGSVDKVGGVIKSYRNDAAPKIAVTVDLLTTGIDVPKITNLVFLRRVNSRILYEQMLGRATRLCPEIGKEVFRIFDAVDLYSKLQDLTEMKPVAADPNISLTQLLEELVRVEDERHRADIRDQIIVRMSRRLRRMPDEARAKFEQEAGETPEDALARFRAGTPADLAEWARARPRLGPALDWTTNGGTPAYVPISTHEDSVVSVTRGYGDAERPHDFLDGFAAFVRTNLNAVAGLQIAVQRPRDLTREALRQLRLRLDADGYSEANLKRAYADARNQDMAASIIGYIRQAALGDALVPYTTRVRRAVDAIIGRGGWTEVQKKWLRRIGEQLEREVVVDATSLDEDPFRGQGGFRRIDKQFDGKLETLLADIREEVWRQEAS
jgi:type I restriction enzyme R subunit